jgi:co-chaperonin GroES (HSP10)
MDKNIEVRPEVVEDNIKGYAPLNLDDCGDISSLGIVPENAKKVLGDIILCEVIDENEHGEVLRNGIWIKENMGTKTWRKAKVLKMGKKCEEVQVNDIVVYPSDKGIKIISANKKKYVFLNESRIFYIE